jgi:hypothetical protein
MDQHNDAEEKVMVWDGQFHHREMRLRGSVQSRICGHAVHPVSPCVYWSLSIAPLIAPHSAYDNGMEYTSLQNEKQL